MKIFIYVFFCIMIMSGSLYATEYGVKNASDDIYNIVQSSHVGEACGVDIREYNKGMFTVIAICTDSNGKEVRSFVSKLRKDDLYRLCIFNKRIHGERDCSLAKSYPEKFSQELTNVVKNNGSAHKSCENIKVFKINNLDDAYNVYADCKKSKPIDKNELHSDLLLSSTFFNGDVQHVWQKVSTELYFVRKKDLSNICNLHGSLSYGKKCN